MTDQEVPISGGVCSGDIIKVLRAQHADLRNFLKNIMDDVKKDNLDLASIAGGLRKFNVELVNHADFENCAFYQPLFKKMEGQGFDIEDIREFVVEMSGLLDMIGDFVKKYKEEEVIRRDVATFSADLSAAISELETRIVAEEEGVFIYW